MITAKVVADSLINIKSANHSHRKTTMEVVFPRFILAELNTHRLFSRNSASSRAIPFEKMIESVQTNPFIPIAWQKDHKGMQGTEYWRSEEKALKSNGAYLESIKEHNRIWLEARDLAILKAKYLNENGVTKQLCNRLLEPFMWHKVLITATEWDNFFELRCPQYDGIFKSKKEALNTQDFLSNYPNINKDSNNLEWFQVNKGQSEIHMMALAEAMYDALEESTPKELKAGEWHIPFGDDMDEAGLKATYGEDVAFEMMIKIAVARCARVSYTTVGDNTVKSHEEDIKLFDRLYKSGHLSPFEHVSRAMTDEEWYLFFKGKDGGLDHEHGWCLNSRGFMQLRYFLQNKLEW